MLKHKLVLSACMAVGATGCLGSAEDSVIPAAALMEAGQDRALGPDVCRIQTWAAQAVAIAQHRDPTHADADRVAWNLSQIRIAALLEKDPGIAQEVAVDLVSADLRNIYSSDSPPPICENVDHTWVQTK